MNVDKDFSKMKDGRKLRTRNCEKPISREVQFNVLRSVMPVGTAAQLAGMEVSNAHLAAAHDDTVAAIRERLQNMPSFSLKTQVEFYANIRDKAENVGDKLAAAKQIDTVLGYNAPQKVEINERRELLAAIKVVSNIGVNPMDLKRMVDSRRAEREFRVVEDSSQQPSEK